MTADSHSDERRKGDRRKLYGKPFLAMLIGGLPEDRRKSQRRAPLEFTTGAVETVDTLRAEFAGGVDVQTKT